MRTLPLLLLLVACSSKSEERASEPAPAAALPVLTDASQAALAKDVDDAGARGTWSEVKRKWTGQVVRWNVTRHRTLCGSTEECFVAVFPVQRPAKHGWLPEVKFAAGQYAALESACGSSEACELAIEGTLEKLELSEAMPTNLRLANVRVITKTAQR